MSIRVKSVASVAIKLYSNAIEFQLDYLQTKFPVFAFPFFGRKEVINFLFQSRVGFRMSAFWKDFKRLKRT